MVFELAAKPVLNLSLLFLGNPLTLGVYFWLAIFFLYLESISVFILSKCAKIVPKVFPSPKSTFGNKALRMLFN